MKYVKKSIALAVITSAALSGVALAEGTPTGDAPVQSKQELNPYTDCGIGSVFKNDTAAVISNVIWDLGTTAVSSKISSPTTCNKYSSDVAQFILDTYPSVAEDTAKAKGSHLTAMLTMAGCADRDHAELTSRMRQEFGTVVAADNYANSSDLEKAERLYKVVSTSTAGQCKLS
ncbi:DUF3015 family protein [Amphritea sp. HPY]|uniref:DUF3015 family protein n=1 Tax=Amphritea sp. HPY TaxID=3421652 RepID=UPI003D7C5B04